MPTPHPHHIANVRRFHRLVTQRAGALDDHFLGRDRPLGESRLLFEIGPSGAEVRELRGRLGLDSGYCSRLLQSLVAKGLVSVTNGAGDERVRRATLTAEGRVEWEEMERRSDGVAAAILEPLSDTQRERLVGAMAEVHRLLLASGVRFERVEPADSVARWCLGQYFAELTRRFDDGFDPGATLPTGDDFAPPTGVFLVAWIDGQPVACGGVKANAPGVGYAKRMWVAESARGLGLGRRLLGALELAARGLGFHTLQLETNRALTEAIAMYRSSGYVEVPAFNDERYAHHWFEKRLDPA